MLLLLLLFLLLLLLLLQPVRIARFHVPRFSPRVGLPRHLLFIGSGVRLSRGWVQKDESLRTRIGCITITITVTITIIIIIIITIIIIIVIIGQLGFRQRGFCRYE